MITHPLLPMLIQIYLTKFTYWKQYNNNHILFNNLILIAIHKTTNQGFLFISISREEYRLTITTDSLTEFEESIRCVQGKGIPIWQYEIPEESGLSKLMQPKDLHLDPLWHALCFNPKIDPESCPGRSRYMSLVSIGDYLVKSMVHMLPIIDLDPNDMSCIYSSLSFIIQQSQELELQTLIVTFDQPLWIKASENVHAKCMNMVLILGGFHTVISFAGGIGSLISGSDLAEAL